MRKSYENITKKNTSQLSIGFIKKRPNPRPFGNILAKNVNMSIKRNNQEIGHESLPILKIISASIVAAVIRYCLMVSKYQSVIANHIEVSTPLNSWKRVSEGLHLLSISINPYNGDLLHETPFSLHVYKTILELFQHRSDLMFITLDVITGLVLLFTTRKYVIKLYEEETLAKNTYAKDAVDSFLKPEKVYMSPYYALLSFLFNPFTLLSCVGYSTTVFHNYFISLMLLSMVQGMPALGGVFLAICASMSFYPLVLVIPMFLYFKNIHKSTVQAVVSVTTFILATVSIAAFSSDHGKDFSYLKNVYGCILNVPDLQPNIGLFWYFFTEMFDHFRELFIFAFQINASLLYLVPLSLKFRKQPFLLTLALLFVITIFKSYPSIGDVGFVISLLPCFSHLFMYTQQGFLVGVILLISTSLAPIVWYLWIYCNSANANFYFGVTLAFAIAQIFLLTDILFAQVKREFILMHGKERKIDGEESILCLE